ncbi:hypothetical protein [Fischerella major]
MTVAEEHYFLDLLFHHRSLQSLIAEEQHRLEQQFDFGSRNER